MGWTVTADQSRFQEAVQWFRSRIAVTQEVVDTIKDFARQRAFTIAGVAQLDIIEQVHSSLEAAIAEGTTLGEWKKQVASSLTQAWGSKDANRLRTVFVNANQQAYGAGRWQQMQEPTSKALRPYGMFDAVIDSRTTPVCRESDGTILPLDDPWWESHHPQLHHLCRSQVRSLREADAVKRGVTQSPTTQVADKGFGALPTGDGWKPEAKNYPASLWKEHQSKAADIAKKTPPRRIDPSKAP